MQNFGKIKNAFNNMLIEDIGSKNNKNKLLFKQYIKTIRENDALKTQFLVYKNIENKIEENVFKANLFLQENINLLNKFSKKEIFEANANLAKPLLFSQGNDVDINEDLYNNISTLIFTEKKSNTIDVIVEATDSIISYMKLNKLKENIEVMDLPSSMLSSMMVDKYNERYSTLEEGDKKILKTLISSTDIEKQGLYSTIVKECIEIINEKIKDSDLDIKDRLLSVKDKLLNDKKEINEDFIKNISKLVSLKESLNG